MGKRYEHQKRQRIEVAKLICALYKECNFSIATCCEVFGVPYITFNQWAQPSLTAEDISLSQYRRGFVIEVHEMYHKAISKGEPNSAVLRMNKIKEAAINGTHFDFQIAKHTYTTTKVIGGAIIQSNRFNQTGFNNYIKSLCFKFKYLGSRDFQS